jgi:hypothetical protein
MVKEARDGGQGLPSVSYAGLDGVEPGDDATLFGQRRHRKWMREKWSAIDVLHGRAMKHVFRLHLTYEMAETVKEIPWFAHRLIGDDFEDVLIENRFRSLPAEGVQSS